MKKWLFILAVLPMLFFSCRKDIDDITITSTDYQPPVVIVTGHLSGLVISENNTPVANAIVRIENSGTTTDENGLFQFTDIEMNSRGTYVTIEKQGYFPGSTRFFPKNNSSTFVNFELLRKTIVGTVAGTEGGSVTVQGAKVTLASNGVVDAQNNTYTGEVHVAAKWLDPTAPNLNAIMPGNLQGVNTEGQEVAMETYGMLAVELQDAAGNELQVAPGQKAGLEFPIPSEMQGYAPMEIPLWSFDEDLGLWIEEGKAIRQGDIYVGKVSHFSFWNCDYPYSSIHLSGTLVNQSGKPVANQAITITISGQSLTGYGYTDVDGYFGGLVPKDEPLIITLNGACSDLFSANVGSFSADTDLGTITVSNQEASSVAGTVLDCDGAPIVNSIIMLDWPGNHTQVISNAEGNFSTSILSCENNTLTVQAFDLANNLESEELLFEFSTTTAIGNISICDIQVSEYIYTTVDEYDDIFLMPTLNIETFQDSILVSENPPVYEVVNFSRIEASRGNSDFFTLKLVSLEVGTHTAPRLFLTQTARDADGNFIAHANCGSPCEGVTVEITANGGSGGYLEGTATGMISTWDANQQMDLTFSIDNSFRVLIP